MFCVGEWRRQWHPTPVLLPRKSHGRRSLVGCSPRGLKESDTTEWLHFHFSLSCIGEGNGSPLQCSCLKNPRDGGTWWAAIYGVTQSWTRLKQLSSSSSSVGERWSRVQTAYIVMTENIRMTGMCLPLKEDMWARCWNSGNMNSERDALEQRKRHYINLITKIICMDTFYYIIAFSSMTCLTVWYIFCLWNCAV